ncbi:TetR/AcrR family transcriptional regulator [Nonlabens xiamenensis]|uniref:TetR/AcrR family transcriptional regulator n=1 Tax=Nonlabens xiamenensis TaxID=2341043 RepID=UPI000F6108B7|nr:TetR/AcrR family transcriptional regulator [Nonlabens xiamenensis]
MPEVKEQILTTSLDLFLSLGFKSVTMDEIASRMGMSKKTLYTYYKNKGQLVEESSLHKCHQVCECIDQIVDADTENPIEELYSIKKYVMKELKGDDSSPMYQLQKYYPDVFRKLTDIQFAHIDECIRKNVNKGIEQGLYRDNINVGFIARIYFVGMQGIKNLNIFPSEEFPAQELFEQYLEYHLRGIVTPQGRKILNKITNSNHD